MASEPTQAQKNQIAQGEHSPNQTIFDIPKSNPNEDMFKNGYACTYETTLKKGKPTAEQTPGRTAFK